ncbi:30S ribosomal protein S4 [archaeon]|jgi:small subunit ribosomal protein S4|nr:30S ribosomal protein S4 [archaeon]
MKKQQKKYSRPQKPFDKARIDEENVLREKYGLKTKREIWKADAAIKRVRNLAKKLITASDEEKSGFIERYQKKGFPVESIADALALDKEDWLKRRLQTIVVAKKFANTPKQARQLITHKHVAIGNQIVNVPSYQVGMVEEGEVKLNLVMKIPDNKKSKIEKIKKEVLEEGIEGEVVEDLKKVEKAEEVAPEGVPDEGKEVNESEDKE